MKRFQKYDIVKPAQNYIKINLSKNNLLEVHRTFVSETKGNLVGCHRFGETWIENKKIRKKSGSCREYIFQERNLVLVQRS